MHMPDEGHMSALLRLPRVAMGSRLQLRGLCWSPTVTKVCGLLIIKSCRGSFLGRVGSRDPDFADLHLPKGFSERFAAIGGFNLPLISQCSFKQKGC